MFRRSAPWGVTHLLILLLVVSLLPFIVLEIYRARADVQEQHDALTQQTQNQAVEAALVTGDFLRFTQRFLASEAGARSVQKLDASGAATLLRAIRLENPNYESVFLFDADGRRIASSGPSLSDLEAAQWPRLQNALTADRMTVSEMAALPGTDRSVLILAYPVSDPSGQKIGVIGVALNVVRLSTVISYPRLPSGAVVLLTQRDGRIIAASSDAVFWTGQSVAGLPRSTSDEARATAGTTQGRLPDGRQRFVAYQPVGAAPWLVMSALPQAQVDATFRRSILRIGEEITLVIAATMVLAWIMLRRLLVPIRMLSDGASAFAAGFLDRRIPLRRHDELGALADALNTMAADLQARLQDEHAHSQALQSLNRLQTEFVATASHELRTPVTAIRTYAEALLRPDIVDEDIRRECLQGIDHSSQRLARLARSLLDVSRIDSGEIAINFAWVDVLATVHAAVAQAAPQDDARVAVRAPDLLPPLRADPERLEDVLANLIANALKFSPPQAPVTVALRHEDGGITIAVHDEGAGISSDEQTRIFDRFYQVQHGTGRQTGGAGLGLYISQAYVLKMGGRIWVESAPGRGSTFFVALPAERPERTEILQGGPDGSAALAAPRGR